MPTLAMQFFLKKWPVGRKLYSLMDIKSTCQTDAFAPQLFSCHTHSFLSIQQTVLTLEHFKISVFILTDVWFLTTHSHTHKKKTQNTHPVHFQSYMRGRNRQTQTFRLSRTNTHTDTHIQIHKMMSSNLWSKCLRAKGFKEQHIA